MQILESNIERRACQAVRRKFGIDNIKLITPGKTGYPDRLFFVPGGKPLLVEFKRPGSKPRAKQMYIHRFLSSLGYVVRICDTVPGVIKAVESALKRAKTG